MAEANLGGALAELGKLEESKGHLEKALKLDPQNQVARENLDEVQRQMGAKSNP